jgi:hypothetical protein
MTGAGVTARFFTHDFMFKFLLYPVVFYGGRHISSQTFISEDLQPRACMKLGIC